VPDEEPLVAAVIVNFNSRELLIEAVDSLDNSDYPTLRIIVIDNNSHDGSVEAIQKAYPNVDIIQNNRNVGFALGCNQGLETAVEIDAKFVLFINSDATVEPDTVTILVQHLEDHSKSCAVAPYIFYYDHREIIWYGGGVVALWRGWIGHRFIRLSFPRKRESSLKDVNNLKSLDSRFRGNDKLTGGYDKLTGRNDKLTGGNDKPHTRHHAVLTDYLTGCIFLARVKVLHELNGFDASYGLYSEDVDLSLRLRRAGWELWVTPEARGYHRVSATVGGELSPFKAFYRGRSSAILIRRYIRLWELPSLVVGGIMGGVLISLKLLLKGQFRTVIAIWEGIVNGLLGWDVPDKYLLEQ